MIEQFERIGRAVADTSRLRILALLRSGELCVCQITAVLELAPATVSKHLSLLRQAGLLRQRKDGRWVYYRLAEASDNPYGPGMLALLARVPVEGVLEADRRRLTTVKETPLEVLCAPAGKKTCAGGEP